MGLDMGKGIWKDGKHRNAQAVVLARDAAMIQSLDGVATASQNRRARCTPLSDQLVVHLPWKLRAIAVPSWVIYICNIPPVVVCFCSSKGMMN